MLPSLGTLAVACGTSGAELPAPHHEAMVVDPSPSSTGTVIQNADTHPSHIPGKPLLLYFSVCFLMYICSVHSRNSSVCFLSARYVILRPTKVSSLYTPLTFAAETKITEELPLRSGVQESNEDAGPSPKSADQISSILIE